MKNKFLSIIGLFLIAGSIKINTSELARKEFTHVLKDLFLIEWSGRLGKLGSVAVFTSHPHNNLPLFKDVSVEVLQSKYEKALCRYEQLVKLFTLEDRRAIEQIASKLAAFEALCE